MTSLQFVFLVFGVVAVSLGSVSAFSDEERNKIYAGMLPLVLECSKDYGLTEADLKAAKESGSIGSINPCLMACVFKKINVINDKGLFDVEKAGELSQKFLAEADDQQKATEVIKTCSSVNEKDVSDAEKGCDRSKLLFDCLLPFKAQFTKSR
uniref:Odorant binding protein 11 n=1 Tax=Heliconius charithonia TaxID=33434 RepID=A0AA49EZV3_HELCH|nr:odorant binding protein 11 [Heliconius charithonia]